MEGKVYVSIADKKTQYRSLEEQQSNECEEKSGVKRYM
jgi:hypothetical protein